ncbi:aminotransferase class V-fold PLP-dependent enzyme [Solwaraspora sp. WMMD937]|uniref:pyridoxal phosphate-dependent decarboxylase family protein n=1 Tax=Solwaraspora sp. WMMD937 TaxID=3016090 RepID=UPI00249A4920|nr:aminotransferase class V-fold PLP-dependent enzyme [Solwaraspora sp. WMMD937]WFE23282.1 aminotransferase class V-fold PLP-dependent enzyme [Solwaraspora sp. WMMD937]
MAGALPVDGVPGDQVLDEIRALRAGDAPTHGGRLFAYVYDPAVAGLDELAHAAYGLSAHVNGLDPTAFPSLLAMENALVGAAAALLGGGPVGGGSASGGAESGAPEVVGSVTSGGTESLILAVKAARDARPEVTQPRMVVPASAHAAFAKAAHYLGVRVDTVPVSPVTLRPDPADVGAAIGPDTVLVACSAPSYAHGVIDPVEQIASLAAVAGVRCHVDACFGGWSLPWLRRLGRPVPAFDFTVPGVTSISVDLHKYAYTPKGVSVLLHRDPSLRRPQYFAYADWPGYTMINPGVSSTRSGGPIAAAYAVLRHLGEAGYLALAERTMAAVDVLADAVRATDGVRLLAEPESTVVCFTADTGGGAGDTSGVVDVFVLADELAARGWHTQPQMSYGDIPASIHLSVAASVAEEAPSFAPALADAVSAAQAHGLVTVPPELATMLAALASPGSPGSSGSSASPGTVPTPDVVGALAGQLGLGGPAGPPLPERMAVVNTVLDLAPPGVREQLLIEFLSLLQRPSY